MPSIGRESKVTKHQPTELELEQKRIIDTRSRAVHDSMLRVKLHVDNISQRNMPGPGQSDVVTYALPGEPDHIKMTAWIYRPLGEDDSYAELRTRLVSTLEGETVPLTYSRREAFAEHGSLCCWDGETDTNFFENAEQRLGDLADTVRCINDASIALREQQVGEIALADS